MQTFIPYDNVVASAQVLDNRRLGKQRVETLQLLRALAGVTTGWVNHPAAKMWRNHEQALATYGVAICQEWVRRGFKDTCHEKIVAAYDNHLDAKYRNGKRPNATSYYLPSWWGDKEVHESHQSNLLRKDSTWYGQFGWSVSDDLPYKWPLCECVLCKEQI